jgi:hypothetical protein
MKKFKPSSGSNAKVKFLDPSNLRHSYKIDGRGIINISMDPRTTSAASEVESKLRKLLSSKMTDLPLVLGDRDPVTKFLCKVILETGNRTLSDYRIKHASMPMGFKYGYGSFGRTTKTFTSDSSRPECPVCSYMKEK